MKTVAMAVRDPASKKLIVDEVEIQTVKVNVRNRDPRSGGHVLSDVALDEPVYFRPGEVKTLEISEALATELKSRTNGTWVITTAALTPLALAEDDDDIDCEPTSSEASALAAAAEEQLAGEVLDAPPIKRVQRRTKR